MSTTKRRKLNTEEQPQPQSAFARLRQSRAQAKAPSTVAEAPAPPDSSNGDDASPTPRTVEAAKPSARKKSRKGKNGQSLNAPEVAATEGEAPQSHDIAVPAPVISTPAESEIASPEDDVDLPQVPALHLSSFTPSRSNFRKKSEAEVHLKLSEGERLVLLGSYGLRVSSGTITISGATLTTSDKTHWVHAPHCYSLPVIRCPEGATLNVVAHPSADSIQKLGSLSPLFRRLWNENVPADTQDPKGLGKKSTFTILLTTADGPKKVVLSDLKSPPEWNRDIEKLTIASRSRPITVMVTGPKSAGKSTFGRLLTNQLLTDSKSRRQLRYVAVMDLDPGQPEYGVPGQVSLALVTDVLLSPSFCRPLNGAESPEWGASIVRSHTLASITPASDPKLYLAAAADLLSHYHNRYGNLPLVINTAGWIQGTGLDLLTSLMTTLRPTHVVYMARGPADVVESLQECLKSGKLMQLPSQSTQYASRTAAHLRTMQTMSYFHADNRRKSKQESTLVWNSNPLSAIPPWRLQYGGSKPGLLGVMCYDYQAPSMLLADAINGAILAAVEIESTLAFGVSLEKVGDDMELDATDETASLDYIRNTMTITTPEGIPFLNSTVALDPRYSQTIGLVLVRGIDVENQALQIITPIPDNKIKQINEKGGNIVLVSGKFDPPSWAYSEDLYRQAHLRQHGAAEERDGEDQLDIIDGGEGASAEQEQDGGGEVAFATSAPWIEVLRGNEKRGVGSRVWRVRRDLGRGNNAASN
ncbi:hypothetical protein BX600DRAFT_264715 [Xylariales sp. PMI_506]|nr:hypothetical protein BX600DRAFT_264715 [Xylariales sp. PMI_506]